MRSSRIVLLAVAALVVTTGCSRRRDTGGTDRSDGALPEVTVPRRTGPTLVIDGRLDEPAWRRAAATGAFVQPGDGRGDRGSPVQAEARLLWDDEALHVGITVRDRAPVSPFHRDDEDPHVWALASGIELMLQPGDYGDGREYYEVQVDVAGAVWDTRFDDYNRPIQRLTGGVRYGHQEWRSSLRRAVHVDRRAGAYTVELSLPWSSLLCSRERRPGLTIPPRPGETWRANLYSFRDGQRHALAWSPILGQGNFHRAARFGRLRFGGS
jgi:hypothetical protein